MSKDKSDTNIMRHLHDYHNDFYKVMVRSGFENKNYHDRTIIVPPIETIKEIDKLLTDHHYREATNIIKSHLLRKDFPNGASFKEEPVISWYSKKIIVKNVKDNTVEIKDGTLTLDADYYPTREVATGEEKNITSIWLLKGKIDVMEHVEPEKKNIKKKVRGGNDVDDELINDRGMINLELSKYTEYGGKNSQIVIYFVAILDFLMYDRPVIKSFAKEYPAIKTNYAVAMKMCFGGLLELDMLFVFKNKSLFEDKILYEILYMQTVNSNFDPPKPYEIYIEFMKSDLHKKYPVVNLEKWPEKRKLIKDALCAEEVDKAEFLTKVSTIVQKNRIEKENGVVIVDEIYPPFLYKNFVSNMYTYCRFIETTYLMKNVFKTTGSTDISMKHFIFNYKDFSGSASGLLDLEDILGDRDYAIKYYSESLCYLFERINPANRTRFPCDAIISRVNQMLTESE